MAKNTIIENKLLAVDIGGFTLVPVGTIVPYPGDTAPLGWMFCDGRSITKEEYPELYAVVGSKVPDLRGEFIRGLDRGRGVDSGRVTGSAQTWSLPNITGKFEVRKYKDATSATVFGTGGVFSYSQSTGQSVHKMVVDQIGTPIPADVISFNSSNQFTGTYTSTEIRPRNVAMNYIIKYRHIASHVGVIDSEVELNKKIEDNTNLIQANMGSGGLQFIQTVGQKTNGTIYYDQDTIPYKPYLCIKDNSDITPTSNFIPADNNTLASLTEYKFIDFSSAHANLNKANLEVYGKLCILSAEIVTGTANTLVLPNVIPEGYGSQIQVRVGAVSRDANPKGASLDVQGRNLQVISYGQNPYVVYTTASWIRA